MIALRISRAASSRISIEACSLYQAACGVQIRFGASFKGPWLKLNEDLKQDQMTKNIGGGGGVREGGEEEGDPDGFVHTQTNFYNRKELHFYSLLGLFFNCQLI